MAEAPPPPADKNAGAFRAMLPKLLKEHSGKFALFHEGEFIDAFDTMSAAYSFAVPRYGLSGVYIGCINPSPPVHQAPALVHGLVRGRGA